MEKGEEREGGRGSGEGEGAHRGALIGAVDSFRPVGEAGDSAVGRWRRWIGR
uniref:p0648C09.5 protein n=1 Tax=Oryza sativa subsp. japonica TaxID=39947 RepID=Q8RUN3_ORYSJ|nr:P0648C09.5 [Oryza sativa Japonica Group]